jgi:hypothetical protein
VTVFQEVNRSHAVLSVARVLWRGRSTSTGECVSVLLRATPWRRTPRRLTSAMPASTQDELRSGSVTASSAGTSSIASFRPSALAPAPPVGWSRWLRGPSRSTQLSPRGVLALLRGSVRCIATARNRPGTRGDSPTGQGQDLRITRVAPPRFRSGCHARAGASPPPVRAVQPMKVV